MPYKHKVNNYVKEKYQFLKSQINSYPDTVLFIFKCLNTVTINYYSSVFSVFSRATLTQLVLSYQSTTSVSRSSVQDLSSLK